MLNGIVFLELRLEVEAKDERAHDVFQAFDNDGSGVAWLC